MGSTAVYKEIVIYYYPKEKHQLGASWDLGRRSLCFGCASHFLVLNTQVNGGQEKQSMAYRELSLSLLKPGEAAGR